MESKEYEVLGHLPEGVFEDLKEDDIKKEPISRDDIDCVTKYGVIASKNSPMYRKLYYRVKQIQIFVYMMISYITLLPLYFVISKLQINLYEICTPYPIPNTIKKDLNNFMFLIVNPIDTAILDICIYYILSTLCYIMDISYYKYIDILCTALIISNLHRILTIIMLVISSHLSKKDYDSLIEAKDSWRYVYKIFSISRKEKYVIPLTYICYKLI